MCWLLPGSFDCFCCPRASVHRPSIACLAVSPPPPGLVTCELWVEAKSAQHGAHADHKKEGKALQEPNTALGAFRKRSVGRECRMTFCIGEEAAPPPPPSLLQGPLEPLDFWARAIQKVEHSGPEVRTFRITIRSRAMTRASSAPSHTDVRSGRVSGGAALLMPLPSPPPPWPVWGGSSSTAAGVSLSPPMPVTPCGAMGAEGSMKAGREPCGMTRTGSVGGVGGWLSGTPARGFRRGMEDLQKLQRRQ